MPIDPTISLQVQPPAAPSNPLGAVQTLTGIANTQQEMQSRNLTMQGLQNQIMQFQQVFGARQKLGQIMSQAPDLETGMAAAQKDSLIATQPSVLNEYRELQNTMAEVALRQKQTALTGAEIPEAQARTAEAWAGAGARQAEASRTAIGAGGDVYTGLTKALLGAADDPRKAPLIKEQFLATLPPQVATQYRPFADSLVSSLMPDPTLPPDQAAAAYRQNFATRFIGAGGDAKLLAPTPEIVHGPNEVPNVMQLPPVLGAGGAGAGAAPGPAGAAVPVQPGGGALPPAAPAAPAPRLAGDGKPLFASPPPVGPTAGSGPGLTGGAAKDLLTQHTGEDRAAYQFAQSALGTIDEMKADLQTLGRAGGMSAPGAAGGIRIGFEKGANALSAVLGGKAVYPPEVIAAAEDLKKNSTVLGFAQSKALLPGQKEGVQTIEESIGAVPGIENTVLGGLLVADSRAAMLHRMIDQWEFRDKWQRSTGGDLTGADEAFNVAHPAKDYTVGMLDGYGLGPKGFKSPQDVGKAYQQNLLTYKQAQDILHDQFKMKPAGTGP